jgi:Pyridine nucleotide-disulphide oxidoreductase
VQPSPEGGTVSAVGHPLLVGGGAARPGSSPARPVQNASGGQQLHVVVGGGFGGLQAVSKLRHAPIEVTLVDRRNFHLFQPLTYQVATGALSPGEITYPLMRLLSDGSTGGTEHRRSAVRDRI